MVDYANRDFMTTLNATAQDKGIIDGTDYIHSGIVKVLENAARGNYIVEYVGSTVFRQTAGSSRTRFDFSGNISYMRDGKLTTATPNAVQLTSDPDTSYNRYDMIVIQESDGHLAVREGTAGATARVADKLTDGDIPVALVEVVAGASGTKNDTTRKVQLYGYNKHEHSVSIGRTNSGAYTEGLTIQSNAGHIEIEAKEQDKDILFKGDDGTVATTALTLDMSEAGKALFNAGADFKKDVTIYEDANNADVSLALGTSAAESLTISVLNGSSNKTAEEVHFSTATASGTANHGKMVFDVDGTDIATIDDGGIDLASGKTFSINGTDIVSSPITAVNNATENELVTIGATTTELEAEAGLTYGSNTLAVTGAVTATTTIAATHTVTGSIGLITDGTVTATGYEIISLAGGGIPPVPTMTKHIIYSHDFAGASNAWVMPPAINGNIYYIKNIFTNPLTITASGGEQIDVGIHAGNGSTVSVVTALNTITLAPQQSVTLHGVNDSEPLLSTGGAGHLVIATGN